MLFPFFRTDTLLGPNQRTTWQVITRELESELVNLRISNIYDLSSVRCIALHPLPYLRPYP